MQKSFKKERDARLTFFNSLDEKQMRILYEMSAVRKLQPGDILYKEGEIDQAVYLILTGKVRTESKGHCTGEICTEGDYIGGIDYLGSAKRDHSAVAVESASVMKIDSRTMDSLEDKVRIFLYKFLNDALTLKIRQMEDKLKDLTIQNSRLVKAYYEERVLKRADLGKSDVIQALIKKIPKLPVFASSLVSMLVGEKTSAEDLTEKIKNDPSLVGTVLKTVNSPYYGFRQKIADIHRAIVMLGFNEMYQLIVSEGVRHAMPKTPEFQKVHSHCVAVSRIAALLSQETKIGRPAEMATIGLLHDIGHVVIQLLVTQNPRYAVFIDRTDAPQLGTLLLQSWNIPDIICGTVRFQYYPEFPPPESIDGTIRNNVILLYISHLCLEYLHKEIEAGIPTVFLKDYAATVKLEEYSIEHICRVWVIPGLRKNMEALPVPLKRLLKSEDE